MKVSLNCVGIIIIPTDKMMKPKVKTICKESPMSDSYIKNLAMKFVEEVIRVDPRFVPEEVDIYNLVMPLSINIYKQIRK